MRPRGLESTSDCEVPIHVRIFPSRYLLVLGYRGNAVVKGMVRVLFGASTGREPSAWAASGLGGNNTDLRLRVKTRRDHPSHMIHPLWEKFMTSMSS